MPLFPSSSASALKSLSKSLSRPISSSSIARMRVVPVPVRSDNYAYLLIDDSSSAAAVVDPYDMKKVQSAAASEGVKIVANLTTHHHHDHSGGNSDFASQYPDAPIYGGSKNVAAVTHVVKDKEELLVGETLRVRCLATPCHTQDSICYYVTDERNSSHPGAVFTGDTLFVAGCGRFFEGNAQEMDKALSYLGTLPDNTVTCVGHEYTAGNFEFARTVEPSSAGMKKLEDYVSNNKITTNSSTVGDEKEWNVFMRLNSEEIRKSVGLSSTSSHLDVLSALRELKNKF